MRRVAQFIRGSLREVAGIFGVVLLLVAITTIASILATAGLGLIAVLPFVGLAMVPLQLAAWLLRGVMFGIWRLTALGAYLTQYRYYLHGLATLRVRDTASDVTVPVWHDELRHLSLTGRRRDAGIRHSPDGHHPGAESRHHFVRARLPGARNISLGGFRRHREASCCRVRTAACCSTVQRADFGRCSISSPASCTAAAWCPASIACS